MLKIYVPSKDLFDNRTGEFIYVTGGDVTLEHSLFSIAQWESKWKKPFLTPRQPLTPEESVDYVRCMVVDGTADWGAYNFITDETMRQIQEYINDPMTATTFGKTNDPPNREIITAEILYWQMTVLGIPIEFEKRHLNQLLTLIKVCSIKNSPKKKMSRKEIYKRNRELNAARKRQLHTKG